MYPFRLREYTYLYLFNINLIFLSILWEYKQKKKENNSILEYFEGNNFRTAKSIFRQFISISIPFPPNLSNIEIVHKWFHVLEAGGGRGYCDDCAKVNVKKCVTDWRNCRQSYDVIYGRPLTCFPRYVH